VFDSLFYPSDNQSSLFDEVNVSALNEPQYTDLPHKKKKKQEAEEQQKVKSRAIRMEKK